MFVAIIILSVINSIVKKESNEAIHEGHRKKKLY